MMMPRRAGGWFLCISHNHEAERTGRHKRMVRMNCPSCSGAMHRRFSVIEKLALFLPVPVGRMRLLECVSCGDQYSATTGVIGYLLTAAFCVCIWGLGSLWHIASAFVAAGSLYRTCIGRTEQGLAPAYT
jgi:hypothetical protein